MSGREHGSASPGAVLAGDDQHGAEPDGRFPTRTLHVPLSIQVVHEP